MSFVILHGSKIYEPSNSFQWQFLYFLILISYHIRAYIFVSNLKKMSTELSTSAHFAPLENAADIARRSEYVLSQYKVAYFSHTIMYTRASSWWLHSINRQILSLLFCFTAKCSENPLKIGCPRENVHIAFFLV